MPLIDSEKIQAFSEKVIGEANDRAARIASEAYDKKQAELAREEERVKSALEAKYRTELKNIRESAAAELSRLTLEKRKEYLTVRDGVTEKTISRTREKLVAFTHDERYPDYMCSRAKKAASALCTRFTVYVKEEDMPLADILKEAAGDLCDGVCADGGIEIGGLIARSETGGMVIDNTLDEGLAESRKELMLLMAKYVRVEE